MLQFKIEQIAICPAKPYEAMALLQDMGAVEWIGDTVIARGKVFGKSAVNMANLTFNYELIDGNEFEVLDYFNNENWMNSNSRKNSVSHFGMHCTEEELNLWKDFFKCRGIKIAQEVYTVSHTNEAIKDKRRYHYTIFDTKEILGVDLKFIVRINIEK